MKTQNQLIHENETSMYIVAVIISVMIYLSLLISIIGIVYIGLGLLAALFMHGLMVAGIRSSGVKLSERQFPVVYSRVRSLCMEMGIERQPDVFIVQSGGVLNAFATRFFGRNFVVLYSDIFELVEQGNDQELSFVIAHELAHIQRKHLSKHLLILPALWIPFLGNAYYRACEYTCDRMAAVYIGDTDAAVRALTVLAVGKQLFSRVNIRDYLEQSYKEHGFFIGWYELISSHPPLPKRINEVLRFREFSQRLTYDPTQMSQRETEPTSLPS